ncbi:restriction endonuclease subunit S [Paraburkholderia youngii]|uniref:restriction endonuclease subunit S n=1 Tax=Paraburkholderia youngii TaxID=2782701 RepID=UPI003D1B30BC
MILSEIAQVSTAMIFRDQAPKEDPHGSVRALAIRDLVASKPLQWQDLPRIALDEKYLQHCLRPGDVVIPSRGDYYKAWIFEGAGELVFPLGQLNIIRPSECLDPRYLVWYLNRRATQDKMSLMLTGTSIKALTKTALLTLEVEVPSLVRQRQIAELNQTTQRIMAVRHRMNELDREEIAYLTNLVLQSGGANA